MQLLRVEPLLPKAAKATVKFQGLPLVDHGVERLVSEGQIAPADNTAQDNEAFDRHYRWSPEFNGLGRPAVHVLRLRLRMSIGKLQLPPGDVGPKPGSASKEHHWVRVAHAKKDR